MKKILRQGLRETKMVREWQVSAVVQVTDNKIHFKTTGNKGYLGEWNIERYWPLIEYETKARKK